MKGATYDTCQELLKLHGKISPEDYRKITVALDAFSEGVDKETLVNKIFNFRSDRVTPMMFEFNLAEQAQKHRMRIVLPEGEELRILRAAESLCERGIADIILLGDTDAIQEKIKKFGLKLQDAHDYPAHSLPAFQCLCPAVLRNAQEQGPYVGAGAGAYAGLDLLRHDDGSDRRRRRYGFRRCEHHGPHHPSRF